MSFKPYGIGKATQPHINLTRLRRKLRGAILRLSSVVKAVLEVQNVVQVM